MKFLYLQDFHIKGKNSRNRKGDYFSDCMTKLDEVLGLANTCKVEAILDGGDFFDAPEPSYKILDTIADKVEKYKIPIYSLFGNHSQRYSSNEHSKYTGLAHLFKRSKYFQYADFFDNHSEETESDGYIIKPIDYHNDVEEQIKNEGIMFSETKAWKIAIVHAFVCPKPFPYASHAVCDDIKTNADIVLVAHYHSQWEKKVGNTLFLDIGCLGRNSITEANIEPQVLLLDTEKRRHEIIKLKSAKQAEEIFDLSKIEELKSGDKDLEQFIKSLESADFQSTNIKDIITEISKEQNVDKNITDLILNKMEEING